jgi:hypothetical protein
MRFLVSTLVLLGVTMPALAVVSLEVPEPHTLPLLLAVAGAAVFFAKRKNKKK